MLEAERLDAAGRRLQTPAVLQSHPGVDEHGVLLAARNRRRPTHTSLSSYTRAHNTSCFVGSPEYVLQKGWLQQDSVNRHLPSSSFILVSTSHHDPAGENKA